IRTGPSATALNSSQTHGIVGSRFGRYRLGDTNDSPPLRGFVPACEAIPNALSGFHLRDLQDPAAARGSGAGPVLPPSPPLLTSFVFMVGSSSFWFTPLPTGRGEIGRKS